MCNKLTITSKYTKMTDGRACVITKTAFIRLDSGFIMYLMKF